MREIPPSKSRLCAAERGQATTELVVAAAVLVPLLLLVPMVGKYIDLMQATESASRYVAFEGTVHLPGSASWKTDEVLANDVRRRYFSASTTRVRTGEAPSDDEAQRHALWTSPWGRPLLPELNRNVTASAALQSFNWVPAIRPMWDDDMHLPDNNFITGTVTVSPVNPTDLPAPFNALNLSITRRTAFLADAWTGRGDDAARPVVERMSRFYPQNIDPRLNQMNAHFSELLGDAALPFGLRRESYRLLPCDRFEGVC